MSATIECATCSREFTYENVGGRRRKYCSKACRPKDDSYRHLTPDQRRIRNLSHRTLTCAVCSGPMFKGSTSRPQGSAVCRPCRRSRVDTPAPKVDTAVHHSTKASTVSRGYGYAHQKVRLKLLDQLTPDATCAFCDQPMSIEQGLDLDHSNPADRLLLLPGDRLTHSTCNRRDGAARRNGGQQRQPRTATCEICGASYPYRTGQRSCGRACGREVKRRNAA